MLGLGFTSEQQELRRTLRAFLSKRSDETRVREVMEGSGFDSELWTGLAAELGCHGLAVPEELGGSGATRYEQGIVFEELGRSLACVPYLATVGLAQELLQALDTPRSRDLTARTAAGELTATVANAGCGRGEPPDLGRIRAQQGEGGWLLSGSADHVPDGHCAELLLVVVPTGGDLAVFAVDQAAPGLECTRLATMDQTRPQARVDFDQVPAELLVTGAQQALDLMWWRACAYLAAEQSGAARKVLEGTVEYVKVREQFGQPIGSFQAVKHRLADMLLDVEASTSAARYALAVSAENPDELREAAPLAKAFCSDALVRVTEAAVQLHGGIGLTWEHWAHLYFKRARSGAVLFGSSQENREALAQALQI